MVNVKLDARLLSSATDNWDLGDGSWGDGSWDARAELACWVAISKIGLTMLHMHSTTLSFYAKTNFILLCKGHLCRFDMKWLPSFCWMVETRYAHCHKNNHPELKFFVHYTEAWCHIVIFLQFLVVRRNLKTWILNFWKVVRYEDCF